ncbi:MAG: hypothetical protein LBK47_02235 [Prevotellaceae bacterium]|jgi:hypothetical protein|nr:hypothetical protein [Prevotellaceae bacterium]
MTKHIKIFFFLLAAAALHYGCQQSSGSCDCIRYITPKSVPVITDKDIDLTGAFDNALGPYTSAIGIVNTRHINNELVQCELSYKNNIFGKAIYNSQDQHYTFVKVKFTFKLRQNPSTQQWDIVDAQNAFRYFIANCSSVIDSALNNLSEADLLKIAEEYPQANLKPCNNLNFVVGVKKTDEGPAYVLGWLLNYTNTTSIQLLPTKSMNKNEYEEIYHNLAGGVDFSSGVSGYGDII